MIKQLTSLTKERGDSKGGENNDTYKHKMKLKVKRKIEKKETAAKRKEGQKTEEVSVLENGGYKAEEQNGERHSC